jgi:hypothetical protein
VLKRVSAGGELIMRSFMIVLFTSIILFKLRRNGWAGHTAGMCGIKNAYRTLIQKPEVEAVCEIYV